MKVNLAKFIAATLNEGEALEATKWDDIKTEGELTEEEMNEILEDLDEDEETPAQAPAEQPAAQPAAQPVEEDFAKNPDGTLRLERDERNESLDEDEEPLDEDELNEDELNEDESSNDNQMSEEDLKIESLKIATNIAKLMSDVTTEDIISIADKVSGFIRNHEIGTSAPAEEPAGDEEFDFEVEEEPEENKE